MGLLYESCVTCHDAEVGPASSFWPVSRNMPAFALQGEPLFDKIFEIVYGAASDVEVESHPNTYPQEKRPLLLDVATWMKPRLTP